MYKVDWDAIRREYIMDGKSLNQLSEKYGVSKRSLCTHSTAGDWEALRKKNALEFRDINDNAHKKQIVKSLQYAEVACDKLLKALAKQADDVEKMPPSQANAWAKTLETALRIARDIHNCPSVMEAERIAIAKKDLDMRIEEHKKIMETGSTEPIVIKFENDIGDYAK